MTVINSIWKTTREPFMKKVVLIITFLILLMPFGFTVDRYSAEYLQKNAKTGIINKKAEKYVENALKSALKKNTKGDFSVKFNAYNLSSLKKGIFKHLEITGKDVTDKDVVIPYIHLKTLTDYNYIDYKKNPIEYKSDITFAFTMMLSENTINSALEKSEYNKVLENINKLAYPLFTAEKLRVKIMKNRLYMIVSYNFPIVKSSKDRVFVMSSDFYVSNGVIKAQDVVLESFKGKVQIEKYVNLANLLNPLEFTVDFLESGKCDVNIENVNIIDNNVVVDGKMFIKGE